VIATGHLSVMISKGVARSRTGDGWTSGKTEIGTWISAGRGPGRPKSHPWPSWPRRDGLPTRHRGLPGLEPGRLPSSVLSTPGPIAHLSDLGEAPLSSPEIELEHVRAHQRQEG